jgi:hypothetical protein
VGAGRADIDPNRLAERAFELSSRRKKGKALLFVIDEVGQFVLRSVDKMLDLQAIIQAFGVAGKNRTERRQAVSPFWIAVTSQEKLNEVVTALDSRRIELARLQDRFRVNVDLRQTDISEITARRVLKRTPKRGGNSGLSLTPMQDASANAALWSGPPGTGIFPVRNSSGSIPICPIKSTSASTSSPVCVSSGAPSATWGGATGQSSNRPSRCSSTSGRNLSKPL